MAKIANFTQIGNMDLMHFFKKKQRHPQGKPVQPQHSVPVVTPLLSHIDGFIWLLNRSGEFDYISPSVLHTLGYPDTEFTFTVFKERVIPESQEVFELETNLLKNNDFGEKRIWTIGVKNRQNRVLWLETVSNVIYDAGHNIMGLAGTCRDITERYEKQAMLLERDVNLMAQINTTSDNIWSVNSKYEVLVLNQAFAYNYKLAFGVDLNVGQNILKALPPNLQKEWKSRYDRALNGEKFKLTDHFEFEGVPQYVEVAFNPIYHQNSVIGVSVFSRDISDKVSYAKKLEKNEQEFKWLNLLMLKLVTVDSTKEVFNVISHALTEQYPDSLIAITQFDASETNSTVVSIAGLPENVISKAIELTGINPFLKEYKIPDEAITMLRSGVLHKHPNGIEDILLGMINKLQINLISSFIPVNDAYSIGIVKGKSLFAAIHLVTLKPYGTFDKVLLESLGHIAGIILHQKYLNQALSESETRFKQLVSNVPGVTYRCHYDEHWTMQFISDEIETLTGYPASDFINNHKRTFASVIHPKFVEYVEKTVAEPLRNKKTFNLEYCLVTKMGQIRWVSEKGRAYYNKKGEIEWIDGIITDNSRAKEAEKRLTESEEKFRSIFENSNTAISLLTDTRIFIVNHAWERLFGYTAAEAVELQPKHLFHFDERDLRITMMQNRLKGHDLPNNFIAHMIDKAGHDKWIDLSVATFNYQGKKAILSFGIDITERKKAEMELNKFSTGIMNSPSSIVITDIDGTIEYANPFFTESTGYQLSEVIGQNPRVLQSGLTPREVFTDLWATILRGEVWNGEFINRKKNGDLYWESARIAPITDSEGIITNFVAIKEDITEIKNYQAKLEKTAKELNEINAQKDRFFSIIAHDLRSPFSGLVGITDLLYRHYNELEPSKIETYLKHSAETSHRLYKLLENLLEWAKTQTGRHEYKPEPVNVKLLANDALELIKIPASEKQISLINKAKANDIAYVDANMLFTIFRNLISNALKYSHPNGHIIIDTEIDNSMLKISITDNGVGIPEKVQHKLFKLEETYSTPGTNNEKGTGLGLILCKEFVKKMGGKIWCESTEGKGSSFFFTVPIYTES